MGIGRRLSKEGILLFLILLFPDLLWAATITSQQSGLWSSAATWSGGVLPSDGDDVVIANGHTVEIDQDIGAASGLRMLRVGTQNGSTARLLFTGQSRPVGTATTIRFASSGKARGSSAFGIHFFGSVDLEGAADHPFIIEPVVQDGSAMTFIEKDPGSSHVDLILRGVTLRWAGDENSAAVDVTGTGTGPSRSTERAVLEGNRFEQSGTIQLFNANGSQGAAVISVSRNTAVAHRGSFVQFRAASNLTIDRNQITLAAFPKGSPGQAAIDSILGPGSGIRIEGNTILTSISGDPTPPQRVFGIWLMGFSDSVIQGNTISAESVAYGFEEAIAVFGNPAEPAKTSNILVAGNVISKTIHGIAVHMPSPGSPGIVITGNQVFNNRNEHIFISEGSQIQITNNVLYGTLNAGQAGILLYVTDQVQIINNTLDGTPAVSTAGIAIGNPPRTSTNVVIKNNMITRWSKGMQNRDSGNTFQEVGYNLFFQNVTNIEDLAANPNNRIPSTRTGDVFSDPKYVNLAASDYHLQAGSAAIDKGTASGAPTTDFDGAPRPSGAGFDIGADEYSGAPVPDLAVTVDDAPDPASVGAPVVYTIKVKNQGAGAASGVALTFIFPAEINVSSVSGTQGTCDKNTGCQLGALASLAQATVTVQWTAQKVGSIQSTVQVSAQETDPIAANNQAAVTTLISPRRADLQVAVTKGADPILVGTDVVYTASVTNHGPETAGGVVFTDQPPAGATFVKVTAAPGSCQSASGISCDLGDLASGATATVSITLQYPKAGTFANTVSVTGAVDDSDLTNNSATDQTTVTVPGDPGPGVNPGPAGGPGPDGGTPSSGSSHSGFGCGQVENTSEKRKFNQSHLGDLLLLFWPLFYFLFRRGRRISFTAATALLVLAFIATESGAATITSGSSGPWSSPSTWIGGKVPGDGDEVTIDEGHNVLIDQDIGTPGRGLLMLHVGKQDGSTAILRYDGSVAPRGYQILFASTGKTEGVDAFGIRFWGKVDLQGADSKPLTLLPQVQNGQAFTFIRREGSNNHVDLTLRRLTLRFLGDGDNAGIDVSDTNSSGERIVISDNRFENSGYIQLARTDGTAATISLSRNVAVAHKGPFVMFGAARQIVISQNQVTLASFGTTGEAVIDGVGYKDTPVGSGIRVEGNILVTPISGDPTPPKRIFGIWLDRFTNSAVRGNKISAQTVPYGFEEGIAVNGGPGEATGVQIEGNVISNTIHGIAIHALGNPGIVVTRNRVFDSRNEHIFVSHGTQIKITNNILYGTLHSGQAGILLYKSDQVQIVNNTLDGDLSVSLAGIAIGNPPAGDRTSTHVTIVNNLLTNWNKGISNRDSQNTFDEVGHNLFFQNTKDIEELATDPSFQIPSNRVGDVSADPKYVNIAVRDYHIHTDSAAVDKATAVNAPAVDFDGQARPFGGGFDIGADEASSASIPAPCDSTGCSSVGGDGGSGGGTGTTPPASSAADSKSGGFGCGAVQSRSEQRVVYHFRFADLGDLLFLGVPFFYHFLRRRGKDHNSSRHGEFIRGGHVAN
ncbi:MAG: right-handed parallel beta-helix repeat-containing protein [Nitrospirae bacterium]|nr:right-handed parallel beta-helix repeat-containing protein [Candidatus Manganitrophaceae bacterium]